jgi:serine/threonine protein kinase
VRQAAAAPVEVHRLCALAEDIRPQNMMVRENGDIALVELDCLDETTAADEGSLAPESLRYRAPERLLGMAGDQRSDLYSLGVIFYEMLTGEPPLNGPVPRLGGEPTRFQDLLDRLLAKDPAHRYADTAAALHAIERFSR